MQVVIVVNKDLFIITKDEETYMKLSKAGYILLNTKFQKNESTYIFLDTNGKFSKENNNYPKAYITSKLCM
jgi:hypothetical protein